MQIAQLPLNVGDIDESLDDIGLVLRLAKQCGCSFEMLQCGRGITAHHLEISASTGIDTKRFRKTVDFEQRQRFGERGGRAFRPSQVRERVRKPRERDAKVLRAVAYSIQLDRTLVGCERPHRIAVPGK